MVTVIIAHCTAQMLVVCLRYTSTTCSSLGSLSNGGIAYSPDTTSLFNIGTTATYSCNTGYYLDGNSARTCTGSCTWDGSTPRCLGKHKCCVYNPVLSNTVPHLQTTPPEPTDPETILDEVELWMDVSAGNHTSHVQCGFILSLFYQKQDQEVKPGTCPECQAKWPL